MSQDVRRGAKKFNKGWLVAGILISSVVVFHKPLLLMGCKAALNYALPSREGRMVSYEKMQWEEGAIALTGLILKDPSSELMIDRVELRFKGSVFGFRFAPEVTVVHPQVLIYASNEKENPSLPFLYRTRFVQPRWTIRNGVLQLPSASRFYFSMVPTDVEGSIGCFAFSYDPSASVVPMLTADLSMRGKNLHVGFKLSESDLSRLLPLTALIASDVHRDWQKASGEVEVKGMVAIDSSMQIQEVQLNGSGKKLELSGPKMGIALQCDEVQAAFSYPTSEEKGFFWDKLRASILLKGGSCDLSGPLVENALGMKGLDGELSFEPNTEPHLVLSGSVFQKLGEVSFHLFGKGGVQEDSTVWSEVDVTCNSGKGKEMQGTVSLCSQASKEMAVHVKMENADFEHLEFFRSLTGTPGQCVDGVAAIDATLIYQGGRWTKASIEKCHLQRMRWYFPEQKVTVYSEELALDCAFEINGQQKWALQDLHAQMDGGEYVEPNLFASGLSAKVTIEQGVLQPSLCKGEWGSLLAEVSFLGEGADHFADVKLSGDGQELLSLLRTDGQVSKESLPLNLQIAARLEGGILSLQGDGNVAGDLFKGSASFSTSTRTWSDLLGGNFPSVRLKEGKFSSERLTEKSYGPFVPVLADGAVMSGILQCEAVFSSSRVQVKFWGDELHLLHPLAEIYVPQLKERPAQFFYEVQAGQWRGEVPLADALFKYAEHDLSFSNVEGSFKLEGDHVRAPTFYAECEGLALRGSCEIDFGDAEASRLSLSTSQIAGDVSGLINVLSKFSSLPHLEMPIKGNFSSGDKGFVLNVPMGKEGAVAEWSFKASFDGLQFPLNSATSIKEGRCDVAFDSKSNRLSVDKAEGVWELMDETAFTVQVRKFSAQLIENTVVDFAIKVVDGKKEFAHFEAKASLLPSSEWEIIFDGQATHFGGVRLNITQCKLNDQFQLSSFEMKPILKCQDLHAQASFLQNAGFLPPSFSPNNLKEWQLEGTLQAQLFSQDMSKGFSFHAESRDLKVKGQPWSSFQLRAQKMGEKWLIERLEAGGLMLKGAFVVDADGLTFPQFEGTWEGLTLKGSGFVKPEKKRFSCTFESVKGDISKLKVFEKMPSLKGSVLAGLALSGDFSNPQDPLKIVGEANLFIDMHAPLPVTASNRRPVKFTYNKAQGLVCSGIDLQMKHKFNGVCLADFTADTISLPQGTDVAVKQIQFSLTPALIGHAIDVKIVPDSLKDLEWEGSLQGSGDLEISKAGPVFQGNLKPGRYGHDGKSLQVEQMQLRFEKGILSLRVKTQMEGQPLWGSLQLDLSKEPYGALKLFDNPKADGLKIMFSSQAGKIVLDSLQGSCYGLNCSLAKSVKRKIPQATVLTGDVKVDIGAFIALFPKEVREGIQTMKFGSGYQWQGDIVLFQESKRGFVANGTLSGKEFEAFGYRFRNLEGMFEANSERVLLSNLKIEDAAGGIGIKKIELNKEEGWHLSIPQIIVKQLQPSLMRKIGTDQTTPKPFTIKNFTLTDIRCKLGDKSSLEGSGHLLFVNQFKKESSILDVPLEMIKKIGLDLGIMTPVQGELQLELRGDKFYLVSLDNSFSEGDRAEFYLPPEKDLSYIDLEGKVHIDLKMRQDVMLKITEPFTLTIRGTLDKPRYGLQF